MLIATLLLAVASCGQPIQSAASQRLWTMADLEASFHQGSRRCVNPAGLDCDYFVNSGVNGNDVLQFKLAFSEGKPMGYITTDFWVNYPQIWLEPMYILVTAWNAQAPANNRLLMDPVTMTVTGPIFSIGPQSGFYSPFWQVFYVEVPNGTPPDKYTSAKQLFDDHLVMHPGPNRFASIGPSSLSLPSADDIPVIVQALNGSPIADYLVKGADDLPNIVIASHALTGWLDGAAVSYVDFGPDNFDVGAGQEIQDVPLFAMRRYDDSGTLVAFGAPNVGGVAPLFSHVPGRLSDSGRPQFGALWRLHIVAVPPTAGLFDPTAAQDAIDRGANEAVTRAKVLRVALDTKCFTMISAAADPCVWLDSQRAIEDNLGEKAITRTNFQPACPFVMFNGRAVPPQ
jgi:hypothetical protein